MKTVKIPVSVRIRIGSLAYQDDVILSVRSNMVFTTEPSGFVFGEKFTFSEKFHAAIHCAKLIDGLTKGMPSEMKNALVRVHGRTVRKGRKAVKLKSHE